MKTADIGVYLELLDTLASREPILSYLSSKWKDMELWRKVAKSKVFELLSFAPDNEPPLNPTLLERWEEDGILIEKIAYNLPYGPPTESFFLKPIGAKNKLPVVIGLHDHGGFKFFGKEKIVKIKNEPEILKEHKEKGYEGRSWANELAKRNFAVFVPDLFLFGSRKIPIETLNDELRKPLATLEYGEEEYIKRYNEFAREHEHLLAKSIFTAGSTWPGIFTYEDRRSIDYLLTRDDIDPKRIGCCGLSGGGLRTIFLAGLDERIKCGVCAGFMSTFRKLIPKHIKCHTWMLYLPYVAQFLDLPDIIALRVPQPLMVQFCIEDPLYPLEGQQEADRKIFEIYRKSGDAENYSGKFFEGHHKFDIQMQEAAFDFFEKWL